MIKRMRLDMFKPLTIVLPSIIIGLILLPTMCNLAFYHPVTRMPIRTKPINLPMIKEYSKVLDLPAGIYVKIDLPSNVTDRVGLVAIIVRVNKPVKVRLNVSEVLFPLAPNELYDVYSTTYITFKDVSTGNIIEPKGYIEFKVLKNWLKEENVSPKSVVMLRYHNGWSTLKTEIIGENNYSYYYRAEVPAFSYFTIAVYRIYNVTYTTNQGCVKCHPDVAVELAFSPYHDFKCTFCHHGMSRNVTCVSCHPNVGNFSAHKPLVEWAKNSTLMTGSNEACIACHTYAEIPICNITYNPYISFGYSWGTNKLTFHKVPILSVKIKYWKKYTYESLNLSNKTPPRRMPWW